MTLSIAESLLPQPPSFQKKKAYEIHKVLGVGTFGKVMVRRCLRCSASGRSLTATLRVSPVLPVVKITVCHVS